MQKWLILNKQVKNWGTTKATTEAVYALLVRGSDKFNQTGSCSVSVGDTTFTTSSSDDNGGYFSASVSGKDIKSEMGEVVVDNTSNSMILGAVHWQYFEKLDKIKSHETSVKLKKVLFKEVVTGGKVQLIRVDKNSSLVPGDKIVVKLYIDLDRDMEYLHLKDMHASGLEPINVISGYKWRSSVSYYQVTKDASTNFFMDYLSAGKHIIEYKLYVAHKGNFANGIANIQNMYAPAFNAHSRTERLRVGE